MAKYCGQYKLRAGNESARERDRARQNLAGSKRLESRSIKQRPNQAMLHSRCTQKYQADNSQHKRRKEDPFLRVGDCTEAGGKWHSYQESRQELRGRQ